MLLLAKLKMPEPRKNYIIRENLFRKLENYSDYKLTFVTGGAGSGKTTLISSFIKEYNLSNIKWIALDEMSNEVFSFWRYCIEALKEVLEIAPAELLALYDTNFQKNTIKDFLVLLINELTLHQEIFVILDDFHYITDSFLLETIDFFIKYSPDNLHLIMLSRNKPSLYLGGLNMAGTLLMIDEEDLKLSQKEGLSFLKSTMNLELEDNILDLINTLAEGWIGGLQLIAAGTAKKTVTEIQDLKLTNTLINDYLTKEIFNTLSLREQDFLIKTSILPYFNEEICTILLSITDFKEIIAALVQKRLLIISIDDNNGLYRYHPILGEYLKLCFDKLAASVKKELHLKVADIFQSLGDFNESITHLCQAGDYSSAMAAILNLPLTAISFSYLNLIPLAYITQSPDFAYQRFFYHYCNMETDKCQEIYHLIQLKLSNDPTYKAFKYSSMLINTSFNPAELNIIPLEETVKLPLSDTTKSFLLIKDASILYMMYQYEEALHFIDQAYRSAQNHGNLFVTFFSYSMKSQILEDMGELNKALELYSKMQAVISSNKYPLGFHASYCVGNIGVYLKQLDLNAAKHLFNAINDFLNTKVDLYNIAYTYNFAEYALLCGNIAEGTALAYKLFEVNIYKNKIYLASLLKHFIHLNLMTEELTEKYQSDYENTEASHKSLDSHLIYARLIHKEGNDKKALQILDTVLIHARKHKIKLKIIEANLLKITIAFKNNKNEQNMINLFKEALHYAYKDKILLPFYFEKETLLQMDKYYSLESLEDLLHEERGFVKNILLLKPNITHEKTEEKKLLSERELEVLQILSQGFTNKEIAAKLCISLATVKTHVINIYSKLHVSSRIAAIEEARRQSLI